MNLTKTQIVKKFINFESGKTRQNFRLIFHFLTVMTRKTYNSYKYGNYLESFIDCHDNSVNTDRYYMAQQIKPNVDFLLRKGLTKFEDFAQLFKKYKLKNEVIIAFIKSFEYFVNAGPYDKKIYWIRTRELKKANFNEKNIILTRLVVEYYDLFLPFFSNYIYYNYPGLANIHVFINEFESKAKDVMKQIELNKMIRPKTEADINCKFESDNEPIIIPIEKINGCEQHSNFKIIKKCEYVKKIIILKQ